MLYVMDNPFFPGYKSTDRGERFAVGAHYKIHFFFKPEVLCCAAARFAKNADPVGIVNHEPGSVLFCESDYLRKIDYIALHAENTIDDYQLFPVLVFRKDPFQVCHIVMPELPHFRIRQPAAVNNTCMVHLVDDDNVILTCKG